MEEKRFNKLLQHHKLTKSDFTQDEIDEVMGLTAKEAEGLFAVRAKELTALSSRMIKAILSKPLDSLTDKDIRTIINKGDKGDIWKLVRLLTDVYAEQKKSIDALSKDLLECVLVVKVALNKGIITSDVLQKRMAKEMPKLINDAKSQRNRTVIDS